MTLRVAAVRVVIPTALETLTNMPPGTPRRQEGMAEVPMTLTVPQPPRQEGTVAETLIHTALETPIHMALGTPPLPGQEATAATMTAPAAIRKATPWLASSWRKQGAC